MHKKSSIVLVVLIAPHIACGAAVPRTNNPRRTSLESAQNINARMAQMAKDEHNKRLISLAEQQERFLKRLREENEQAKKRIAQLELQQQRNVAHLLHRPQLQPHAPEK